MPKNAKRSLALFFVPENATRSQKMPNLRFLALKMPSWQPCQLLRKFPKSLSKNAIFPVTQRNLLFLYFFAASQIVASFHETMPLQKGEQTWIISLCM